MRKYYPPKSNEKQFHCIHCGVYASQGWSTLLFDIRGNSSPIMYSHCSHCKKLSYWHDGKMIIPSEAPVPPPHPDLPIECSSDYVEARDIVARSPKAAAALLRLVVQKLMPLLGQKGKNINEDIASLVAKGLPVQVQQALDYCRVGGNNAVDPGEININDTPEIAYNLFNMINFIVEDRIERPKEIQTLYEKLPEEARKAIEKRDGNN